MRRDRRERRGKEREVRKRQVGSEMREKRGRKGREMRGKIREEGKKVCRAKAVKSCGAIWLRLSAREAEGWWRGDRGRGRRLCLGSCPGEGHSTEKGVFWLFW